MQTLEDIDVSIIIPTWNRKNILIDCINALFSQKIKPKDFEILVCDSYSTDGTSKEIEDYVIRNNLKQLKLVQCKNNNVAKKRNVGIKAAKHNYIILLDDDCMPFDNFIENYLNYFKNISDNQIICGQYRTKDDFVKKSNYVRYRDSRNFYLTDNINDNLREELTFNKIVTGNLGFKKNKIIEKNILFNEKILGYGCEDVDWAHRLISAGFKIYKSDIKVFHNETSLKLTNYKMKWFYMANGSMPLLIKYNYAAASKLPMFYLEPNQKIFSHKIKSICTKLLLNKMLTSLIEFILTSTDKYKFFYNTFLFRCVLLGAYIQGIKERPTIEISEEDTRRGWYAKGRK